MAIIDPASKIGLLILFFIVLFLFTFHSVKKGEKPRNEPQNSQTSIYHSIIEFDGFANEGLKASGVHVVTRTLKKDQRVKFGKL